MLNAIALTSTPYFGKVAPVAPTKSGVPEKLQAELKEKGLTIPNDANYWHNNYKGPFNPNNFAEDKQIVNLLKQAMGDELIPTSGHKTTVSVIEFDSAQDAQAYLTLSNTLINNVGKEIKKGIYQYEVDMKNSISLNLGESENDTITAPSTPDLAGIKMSSTYFIGNNPKQFVTVTNIDVTEFNKHASPGTKNFISLLNTMMKNINDQK